MNKLVELMAFYQAYHTQKWNKFTHFFGVPLIIYSLLIPMAWVNFTLFGSPFNIAIGFILTMLIYYFSLHFILALSMTFIFGAILYLAISTATLENSLLISISAFVGGWIIQLIGHVIEKRKPALTDNFFQIFVAPIFLVAELFFICGIFKNLETQVLESSKKYAK
jgi:uncharacterized membrane protein YGL010W